MQAKDYRGAAVVGVVMPVPDTPWMVICKMDQSEAYVQAWMKLWQLAAALLLSLLLLVFFLRAWLRIKQTDQIAQRLEAERKRRAAAERLALVMRHAKDVIFLFDGSMGIVEANNRAVAVYGYTLPELRRLTARDLRTEQANAAVHQDFAEAQQDRGVTFETVHRRKDGATFPVEVSSQPVTVEGRRHVLSIVRDISERRAQQHEIEQLNRLYLVISEVNQLLIRTQSRQELFDEVCRVLVERGGFQIAWVGWVDPRTRLIEPTAVAGDVTDYTKHIRIVADPALPEGRGPSGTAFRENRIYTSNDFFADPSTGPWREHARRAGFNSAIALPLQQEGQTLGLLTVYAQEKNFFQPRKIELLKETAGDMSFALGVFAREERRLKASEGRLQFLMAATPAIIYSLRAGGDFAAIFISPNIRQVLGYDPAAVVADPGFWAAHLHPDDLAAAVAEMAGWATRSSLSREYRFLHADGTWRWMHDEMRVARDDQGRATELVGYWFEITARKEAEAALRVREEIFSSIVGQAVDAIVLVDAQTGRFLEYNLAAHEGLGYARAEFAVLGLGDIERPDTAGRDRPSIGLIPQSGAVTFESRHRHRDGTLRDVHVSAKWLRLQGRDCVAAVWSDITEAKRAEAELRKLSRAVEQSPASVVITDLTGAIEYVNPRFTQLTGYTAAEVIGQNTRLLKSGLTAPEVYADLWRTITQGRVWRGEIINRKKNAETMVELCIVTPVTDAQGVATHFLALKEDVTDRLKNEKRLRQLSRTIEQAPLSVAITDLAGTIEYVNPAFLSVTGYSPAEVIGQNPRVLKSGLTPPGTYAEMWRTLTRGEVWRGELSNKKKNGEVYQERAVIAPVADEAGKITHYIALKEDVTERKRAELALQEMQARYRLIAENTNDSIWLYNLANDRFEYCSPSVFKLRGFTPEEVMQQDMAAVLTPESVAYARRVLPERLAKFAAGDRSALTQIDQVDQWRRDGSVVPTEISTTLLVDPDGRVTHLLGVTRDITERKRAEAAMRESELRYRELFDLESDAILLLEADTGRILRANQAAGVLYGCTPAELEQLRNLDISAEPDLTLAMAAPENRQAGRIVHVPYRRHRRRDGRVIPVEINLRFFQRDGCWLYLAAIRDITLQVAARETLERFNAELEEKVQQRTEELAARTRQIQALLDAIPDTVMRLRIDGTILASQPARHGAADLAAITPRPGGLPEPGTAAAFLEANLTLGRRALDLGTTVIDESEFTMPGGKLFLELRTAPIGSDEFVVFARDITARKHLEAETAAMLEKERQVSEMKTRFIAVTSHEFRTPMTAAMGTVDLLANHFDRLTPPKRTELLGRITHSLHRMTEMLDEILLLNRMDAKRISVAFAPVDLRHELQACIDEIGSGDRNAHVFDFQVSGPVQDFPTDLKLLHHICSNLLSNAVRYSPEGSTVTVRLLGEADRVSVMVQDQGIGIPENDRARIFEPFERGSNVGNIKGTGLGLNIVRRMTELLGGTIATEPVAPTGSRFMLILPRLLHPPSHP